MIQQAIHSTEYEELQPAGTPAPRARRPLNWMLGNLLLLSGLYLLLYVGGLYADVTYERWAARGDNDLQPAAVESLAPSQPNAFVIPVLNQPGEERLTAAEQSPTVQTPTVSRLIIPSIGVDSKVIEVGWEIVEDNGEQVAIWQVAKFAVGQHRGSANPGDGDNVVLAGHVGGEAPVFKDLIKVEPGDQLTVYSEGREYLYIVRDKVLVQEVGVPEEVQLENARYIAATDEELVTLITCWPPTGPNAFDQRLIVRAAPYGATTTQSSEGVEASTWTVR